MTFGKFVSSFMYYCRNSFRFKEEGAQRQRCICQVQQLLRGVVQAEVGRMCSVAAKHSKIRRHLVCPMTDTPSSKDRMACRCQSLHTLKTFLMWRLISILKSGAMQKRLEPVEMILVVIFSGIGGQQPWPARFVDEYLTCSVVCFPAASTMVLTPLNVQLTCTAASSSLRNLLR